MNGRRGKEFFVLVGDPAMNIDLVLTLGFYDHEEEKAFSFVETVDKAECPQGSAPLPSLTIPRICVQEFVNRLWERGYRPTQTTALIAELQKQNDYLREQNQKLLAKVMND